MSNGIVFVTMITKGYNKGSYNQSDISKPIVSTLDERETHRIEQTQRYSKNTT